MGNSEGAFFFIHPACIAKQTQEEHSPSTYQWTHQKMNYDCEYSTVTLARISNNDLFGCSTGYQDYPSLKGLIDAQFALVLYYNAAIPIKVCVTDNSLMYN